MSAHTPGPWEAFFDHPESASIAYIRPAGCAKRHSDDIAVLYAEENAANARLIAAAPELLEALERYHAIIAANIGELDCDGAFEQARAAIAKAKGEAK